MHTFKSSNTQEYTNTIQHLIELQEVNKLLTDLEQEINILRTQTEVDRKKYTSKKLQYEKNHPALLKSQEEVTGLENDILEIQLGIEKCEDRKKKIKTIKEFKAVNHEIDALTQDNALKENQLISKKRDVEFKKDTVEKIQESLTEIKADFDQKKNELASMTAERNKDIEREKKKKQKVENKIDALALSLFNRIYQNKRGLAVAAVKHNPVFDGIVCQGCYSQLPKQIEIDIKHQLDIIFCPSCSRILFFQPTADVLSETEAKA